MPRSKASAAVATRRSRRTGDALSFRDLTVAVLGTAVDSGGATPADVMRLIAHRITPVTLHHTGSAERLRRYLEGGTLRRMVAERLEQRV